MSPVVRESRVAVVLAATLLFSYAYFYQAGGWNQNSRFALIRAILERHTLQIDAYQLHTRDRAVWRGHYYTDKPPGASLLALGPVAGARAVSRLAGVDPESFPGIAWTSYVAAVATSGVFTAIAALAVFWLSRRWGASRHAALFAATAYAIASPAWAYATLFMAHGQTAGCLMLAFAAADSIDTAQDPANRLRQGYGGPPKRGESWSRAKVEVGRHVLVGLAGGWAAVTELQAAIPAALIALLALSRARQAGRNQISMAAQIAAGVAVAAIPLLVYNAVAFGSPFHLGYSSEEGFKELQSGFFGITYPRLSVLRELLFGSYRGLLPLSPLMALTPLGLAWLARRERTAAATVAAAIGAYYLFLNASYFFWEGGWAFGPRQMTPGLPFLALGLAPLWDRARKGWRVLLIAGWIWGAAIALVAVSTTPQPPSSFKAPVRELLWPAFRDGDLSLNHQTFVHGGADPNLLRGGTIPHAAWNLGELAGLHGLSSLLPLLAGWIAAAALIL